MKNMNKNMKKFAKNTLIEALKIYGVSKKEQAVESYVQAKLSTYNPDLLYTDGYGNVHAMFRKGVNKTVLHLNAHLDTVKNTIKDKTIVQDNGIVRAYDYQGKQTVLGADDRAGVASIFTILEAFKNGLCTFNGTLKVSFYKEEEIGCVGSSNSDLTFIQDVDLSITFDRHGSSDIVVGTWSKPFCSNEVGNWFEAVAQSNGFKYYAVSGGISDAYTVSENGINAVNLSVGYYNEHTNKEHLVLAQFYNTIDFAIYAINDLTRVAKTFKSVPSYSNKWIEDSASSIYMNCDKGYSAVAPFAYYDELSKKAIVDDGVSQMEIWNERELDDLINDLLLIRQQIKESKMTL